jgi:hypothetical protein
MAQIGEIDDSFKYFFGIKTLKIVQCSCRSVKVPYWTYSLFKFMNVSRINCLNALRKRAANAGHKGVWNEVTVPEIKAFYGLLILMDVMKFEREELYWSDNKEFPLVRSKFGEIMPRDRFVYCFIPRRPLNGIIASSTLISLCGTYSL